MELKALAFTHSKGMLAMHPNTMTSFVDAALFETVYRPYQHGIRYHYHL